MRKLVDIDGDHVGYEGNGLIKVNSVYFLTGAEWHGPLRTHGTYDMMYGTSKSLFGPYSQRRMGAPHGGHSRSPSSTEDHHARVPDPIAPPGADHHDLLDGLEALVQRHRGLHSEDGDALHAELIAAEVAHHVAVRVQGTAASGEPAGCRPRAGRTATLLWWGLELQGSSAIDRSP